MSEQIEWGFQQYQEVSLQMYSEQTYLSALKAAVLAPSVYLKNINNFEVTFDTIIHHLEVSLSKAHTQEEVFHIHRIAQELFQVHVFLIEQKVNYMKELVSRSAVEKVKNYFSGKSIPEPEYIFPAAMLVATTGLFTGTGAILLGVYLEKLYEEWKINTKSSVFYVQLARTYRKIIASNVYNKQFTLIDNIIDRNKKEIVEGIVACKEWDEGIDFFGYLEYRQPFNFTYLKSIFYRGYRKFFAKRNIISTYIFYCMISFLSFSTVIWTLFQDWESGTKALFFFAVVFLSTCFARFEHRLLLLKLRLWQRRKQIQS